MKLTQTALLVMLLFLAGCNGDDNGTTTAPTPPATTTVPVAMMADVELELLGFGAVTGGQGNLFGIEFRLTESAGVGANINFARLEVFRATGDLEERQEIGAGQIIDGVGDNRLEGGTSEEAFVTFVFRATVKTGRTLRFTMGLTDDFGNDIELVEEFVFN